MKLFQSSSADPLFLHALQICRLLKQAGGRAVFVGGCVRDALNGKQPKDIDIEVYHLNADSIRQALAGSYELNSVGMSFGVLKVRFREIDIALPRVENKTGAGHRGFLVETMPDLPMEEAAARRDFTINAIMYDPLSGELIDPWHGQDDLRGRVLRHVSSHFSEDPLRVLRAMQFAARFDFTVAPETVALCRQIRQEELPPERLAAEWEKLFLKAVRPSAGLHFLKDSDWIRYYPEIREESFPVLDRLVPFRPEDKDDAVVLQTVLLTQDPEAVKSFVMRIWRSPDLTKKAVSLAEALSCTGDWRDKPDPVLRRLALKAGKPALLLLARQALGYDPDGSIRRRFEELGIAKEPPSPWILGRHLQECGMAPGPRMGKILKDFFEAQLDGVYRTPEEALRALQRQYGR